MRFSIKWLLAAVTYAAVVCASVVYASEPWTDTLTVVVCVGLLAAGVGVVLRTGRMRAFAVGCCLFGVTLQVLTFGQTSATISFRNALSHATRSIADLTPNDESKVRQNVERKFSPKARLGEVRIRTCQPNGDWEVGIEAQEFDVVTSPGNPQLRFTGKTVLNYPVPASVVARFPTKGDVEAVIQQHLILLFSLLGGSLGLWFWKREERARAAVDSGNASP